MEDFVVPKQRERVAKAKASKKISESATVRIYLSYPTISVYETNTSYLLYELQEENEYFGENPEEEEYNPRDYERDEEEDDFILERAEDVTTK